MFALPDLPYSYTALEPFMDEATLHLHHDQHHASYVKNLNSLLPDKSDSLLEEVLAHLSDLPQDIRQKVTNHGGGVYNHNFFWQILAPQSQSGSLSPQLLAAINKQFQSLDNFQAQFTQKALAQFGSGWAWLVVKDGQLEIVSTSNQDSPISAGYSPLLAVDVWEHAYYLKYQNRRAEYLSAIWNIINWPQVSKLYSSSASRT